MTPRALSLLAAFASPIFLCAAIVGWLHGLWPATPVTLGIAALTVCSGPLVAIFHVATENLEDEEDDVSEPTFVATSTPVNATEARARAFHNWRDKNNETLERRERERRASRFINAR